MNGPSQGNGPTFEDLELDHLTATIVQRMQSIDTLGQSGIKALTFINGGGIIALFTLIAQGSGSAFVARVNTTLIMWSAAAFAFGLLLVLSANLVAYFAQQMIGLWEQEHRYQTLLRKFGQSYDMTED